MVKLKNGLRIGFLLPFIFSLVGAILLFGFNFLEYYTRTSTWDAWLGYYVVTYTYGAADVSTGTFGPAIAISGVFLVIATLTSLVGVANPRFVNKYLHILVIFFSFLTFLIVAIGTGLAGSLLSSVTDWWVETGFYGGLIGGLMTFIFLGLLFWGNRKLRAQGEITSRSVTPEKVPKKISEKVISKSLFCHKCGKEVPGQFCTYCGTEKRETQEYTTPEKVAPEALPCHKCGKEVSGQYCTYCGAKLRATPEYPIP